MKANNRKLTPLVSYLTTRLYRRPLYGYLWLIWLALVFFLFSAHEAMTPNPEQGRAEGVAFIAAVGLAIGALLLAFLGATKSGREWLLAKYEDGIPDKPTIISIILVRITPLIGLVVLARTFLVP